jgi:SAM-dependent methyltransferase
MTLAEFHDWLLACRNLEEVARRVRDHFDDISLLFFDVSRGDIVQTRVEQKRAFDHFLSGPAMRNAGHDTAAWPRPVIGLFILFASFFERVSMYAELNDVVQWLPRSEIRSNLHAITLYRRVANARTGYGDCFAEILPQLSPLGETPLTVSILAEFYAKGTSVIATTVSATTADAFAAAFRDSEAQQRWPVLLTGELLRLNALTPQQLANELPHLNIRVVEAIYDAAYSYVSPPVPAEPPADERPADAKQVTTQLPRYLDNLIFGPGGLGGGYAPNPEAVLDGMAADDNAQKVYIGSYLPRSFSESYRIFGPLFSAPIIRDAFMARRILNILDVGAGTGGDILGLLHALAESGIQPARIDIISIEGNTTAIPYQQRMVEACGVNTGLNVRLMPNRTELPRTTQAFGEGLTALLNDHNASFDLILTWKFICESYHKNFASALGLYRVFVETVSRKLAPHGLCVVLDTTNKVKGRHDYIPVIMNRETRAYVQSPTAQLGHVIPRSCAYWEQRCRTDACYTQRIFYVSHSRKANITCKTAYKVLAARPFAAQINRSPSATMYRCNTADGTRACRNAATVTAPLGTEVPSGFVLT